MMIKRLSIYFLLGQFTSSLVGIDIGLAQAHVRESATNTLDGGHGEWHFDATINIGVHHTKNVLKLLGNNQRGLDDKKIQRLAVRIGLIRIVRVTSKGRLNRILTKKFFQTYHFQCSARIL